MNRAIIGKTIVLLIISQSLVADLPMLLMSEMSGSSSALKMLRGRAESTIRALNVTLEDISAAGCLKGGVDYFF